MKQHEMLEMTRKKWWETMNNATKIQEHDKFIKKNMMTEAISWTAGSKYFQLSNKWVLIY